VPELRQVQAEMAVCRRCVAAGIRVESMPVFSGEADAEAMLVGQAPGIRERDIRMPFAGQAGARLRRWLEPAGLGTEEAFYRRLYITSVAKCFPGKRPGGGDVRPGGPMIRTCLPWLTQELALVRAPFLISVGTLALEQLAPGVTLDNAVGVELETANGRPLIALPHPSGASPWPHRPGNADKLASAVTLIARRLA
jgi:uracil-DNA glycosylase